MAASESASVLQLALGCGLNVVRIGIVLSHWASRLWNSEHYKVTNVKYINVISQFSGPSGPTYIQYMSQPVCFSWLQAVGMLWEFTVCKQLAVGLMLSIQSRELKLGRTSRQWSAETWMWRERFCLVRNNFGSSSKYPIVIVCQVQKQSYAMIQGRRF